MTTEQRESIRVWTRSVVAPLIVSAFLGAIGVYTAQAVTDSRITRVEKDVDKHAEENREFHRILTNLEADVRWIRYNLEKK